MLQDWENGLVGNTHGVISGLAKRETLGQVMIRAFRPIHARRLNEELPKAA